MGSGCGWFLIESEFGEGVQKEKDLDKRSSVKS